MTAGLTAKWYPGGRAPEGEADPTYPDGQDINLDPGKAPACRTKLEYPARGVGSWRVDCQRCGAVAALFAAGRTDDPRSVRIGCKSG